jgi:2,3-bisphosphoglycerate-independent phosphoglycerate mutase
MADKKTKGIVDGPVVLCILDGWGHREEADGNAIVMAQTPNYDDLWKSSGRALLETSGRAVGLPEGQMGNSEVGHMNIGAGRVVLADLPRIDEAIAKGRLHENPVLLDLIAGLKGTGGRAHLMGLLSPGGVHSHQNHILALAKALDSAGIEVLIHAFLDGRDTPPQSARDYLAVFERALSGNQRTRVVTILGRYFAMDRDQRWARIEKAFRAIVQAQGTVSPSPDDAIASSYAEGITDEFVIPAVIEGYAGFQEGDVLVMANFRADRSRQILAALLSPGFSHFERPQVPQFTAAVGMVRYSLELDQHISTMFEPIVVEDSLGEIVSKAGLRQLRIAETEKYAHVTFFFNGGEEQEFDGEDRILVPSPKVATYDLKPEMSAHEVTNELVEAIRGGGYHLVIVNYANPDMVGHTGKMEAAIQAVETIDDCLGRLASAVSKASGALLITADHGNVERMLDHHTGHAHTAHTTLPVPLLLVSSKQFKLADGRLADIAPTILALMGLEQPPPMTGNSLLNFESGESVEDTEDASHART